MVTLSSELVHAGEGGGCPGEGSGSALAPWQKAQTPSNQPAAPAPAAGSSLGARVTCRMHSEASNRVSPPGPSSSRQRQPAPPSHHRAEAAAIAR